MLWNYAYNLQIWPSVFMVLLMVVLSTYSAHRRYVPGATFLMIASLLAAAWAVGSFMEAAALDLVTRIFWFKVQAATQVPIAIAITCFILEYAWPGRWLTSHNLALLAFPGLLAIVMVLTDDLHHLVWRNFSFVNGSVKPQFSLGSWFLLAYSFGVLVLVNLIVLSWLFWRSPQQRWPILLMLVGQFVGRMIFLLDRAKLVPSHLPFDLLGMSFEFLMYAIALFGFPRHERLGGDSWVARAVRGGDDFHVNQLAAAADGTLYLAGEAGHLYRSDDRGETWVPLPSPYEGSFFGLLPLAEGPVLAFGLRGRLFSSTDRGRTWTRIETATEATLLSAIQTGPGRS